MVGKDLIAELIRRMSHILLACSEPKISHILLACSGPKISHILLACSGPKISPILLACSGPKISHILLACSGPKISHILLACDPLREKLVEITMIITIPSIYSSSQWVPNIKLECDEESH